MIARIKRIWRATVRMPTPAILAAEQLAEAERELLTWQTALENADGSVQVLEGRIKRLRKQLSTIDKEAAQ